jgi:hypothetical protein
MLTPVTPPSADPPLVRVTGPAHPLSSSASSPQRPAMQPPATKPAHKKRLQGKMGSVQRDIVHVREIVDDVVGLRAGAALRYCAVLEVGGTNLLLRSEEEQDALLEGYRALLKGLTFPMQIVIQSHPLDLSAYLARLQTIEHSSDYPPSWRLLARDHRLATQGLVARRALVEHRCYVVLAAAVAPSSHKHGRLRRFLRHRRHSGKTHQQDQQATMRTLAHHQLAGRAAQLTEHLLGLGLSVRRLEGCDLVRLVYESLTPERARYAPLSPEQMVACGCGKRGSPTGTGQACRLHHPQALPQVHSPSLSVSSLSALPPQPLALPWADGAALSTLTQEHAAHTPHALREGLSLADLLAPAWAEESRDALCLAGEYSCCLAVTALAREVTAGWLAPLIGHEDMVDVVLHIHPQQSARTVQQLVRRKAEVRSSRRIASRQGRAERPEGMVIEADIDTLLGKLTSGEERVFATSLYLLVRATSRQQLEERTERVLSVLHNNLLVAHPTTFEQRRAFHACLPEGQDTLMRTMVLDSMSLATAFPFLSEQREPPADRPGGRIVHDAADHAAGCSGGASGAHGGHNSPRAESRRAPSAPIWGGEHRESAAWSAKAPPVRQARPGSPDARWERVLY